MTFCGRLSKTRPATTLDPRVRAAMGFELHDVGIAHSTNCRVPTASLRLISACPSIGPTSGMTNSAFSNGRTFPQ